MNYILRKSLYAFHAHFPRELRHVVFFIWRNVESRVVESEIFAVVDLLFDYLETAGLIAISEGAHEDKMVLGVLSEELLNFIIDVF